MKKLLIVFFIGLNMGPIVLGEDYDITTVYKFNTEEFQVDGELVTTYLNSCALSVHPQTNAIGLPYMIRDTERLDGIIYPLKSPAIPSLQFPLENSQWKALTSGGEMRTLKNLTYGGAVNSTNFFKFKNISDVEMFTLLRNSKILFDNGNYASSQSYIFSESTMADLWKKTNIFLFVQVSNSYRQSFKFELRMHNNRAIYVEISSKNTFRSCPSWSADICDSFSYESDSENQLSLYFSLKGNLKIYDAISQKVYFGNESILNSREDYTHIIQNYKDFHYISYKIVQLSDNVLTDDKTISSPWVHVRNNSLLFINYYRKADTKVETYLKQHNTVEPIQLEAEENTILKLSSNESNVDELVLAKVNVRYPQNWNEDKQIQIKADRNVYIGNIWEGGDIEYYQIGEKKKCEKRKYMPEIYDVALKNIRRNKTATVCLNGGVPDEFGETCLCPPGFTGDICEIACGKNYFGQKCSKFCSEEFTDTGCKGMVLCTPSFGCSCAAGFHGHQCVQECEEGFYGADCSQTCGLCKGGCDKYTGNCRGECDSPYLMWPTCQHEHSYWNGSPVVLGSSYTSIRLSLDLNFSSIVNSFDETRFYMIQYREDTEIVWSNCSRETFTPEIVDYSVENLKPGRKYNFRVLLLDNDLQINDPDMSKVVQGLTICTLSALHHNITVTKFTNSSVALGWTENTNTPEYECPFSSYILEIEQTQDVSAKTRKIVNNKSNTTIIKFLAPNHEFLIKLKKRTVHGESRILSNITVLTDSNVDDSISTDIYGVVKNIVGSNIYLQWLRSAIYQKYYVKYKLIRRLACGQHEINSTLQVVGTSSTNYVLNLEPNAQYQIFVTGYQNQNTYLHNQSAITNSELPNIAPIVFSQKMRVTNDSLKAYWTNPPSYCNAMNGFFKKYLLELLDSQNTLLKTVTSFDNKMEITNLVPKTEYKIRLRYINNVGNNPLVYAEFSFITKATSFLTAHELTAYKTSANLIGIRWKIPDTNSTITGVNVNVKSNFENRSMNITELSSLQCKAWPLYVCYTIANLRQNTKYTVSVDIFSEEFPEGGSQISVQAVTREAAPSPVTEIKVEDITGSNLTISWRIPYLINGILRKFQIEVEHLSSFNEALCCQGVSTVNYVVNEEKEIYSHLIENVQSASSYQVTMRAFTRRLGQDASKIIDIPPPLIPIKRLPNVMTNDKDVIWQEDATKKLSSDEAQPYGLATDLLVFVKTNESTRNSSSFNPDLTSSLNPASAWLVHVCNAHEACSVHIGSEEESDTPYGKIRNRALTVGYNYTIVLAQVNKYLSARSYTVLESVPFQMEENIAATTVKKTIVDVTESSVNEEDIPARMKIEAWEVTDENTLDENAKEEPMPVYDDLP